MSNYVSTIGQQLVMFRFILNYSFLLKIANGIDLLYELFTPYRVEVLVTVNRLSVYEHLTPTLKKTDAKKANCGTILN